MLTNVFCYVCKLFNKNNTNKFVNGGFSNWKKAEEKIGGHENSAEHKKCMLIWLTYVHENHILIIIWLSSYKLRLNIGLKF